MTVKELYEIMDKKIPSSLSCDWDNDGLMCCPTPNKEIKNVLVALDITDSVVEAAIDGKYDAVVSHHPLIFPSLKNLDYNDPRAVKVIKLIQNNIAAMCFHTRLDALEGGVNDILAKRLEIKNPVPFGNGKEQFGRIGDCHMNCTAAEFAEFVKIALDAPGVLIASCGKPIKRVAVLGGSGKDFVMAAREAGADTFVSGCIGYHTMTEAENLGMNFIEAGHYFTEDIVCKFISDTLKEIEPSLNVNYIESNNIFLI